MDALVADVVIVGFGAAGACAALEAADGALLADLLAEGKRRRDAVGS